MIKTESKMITIISKNTGQYQRKVNLELIDLTKT